MNQTPPPPTIDHTAGLGDDPMAARLAANFAVVMGEVLAPRRSRLERLLLRVGVPERAARLAAATPTLRWAWWGATGLVLLFASAATDSSTRGTPQQLAVLLALAPLVPVVAVALSYGSAADPAHEVRLVGAMSNWRLVAIRTLTVLGMSIGLTMLAALSAPSVGWWRLAWLLPSLATTSTSLALATRLGERLAALSVGSCWLVIVIIVGQIGNALSPFGTIGQLVAGAAAALGGALIVAQRRRYDVAAGFGGTRMRRPTP